MPGEHGPRPRKDGGVDPLWSKAPFVMFRYPGLFVSLAVGALLLALAAAAYPLFISASASELLAARINDPAYTRWAAGLMFRNGVLALGDGERPSGPAERSEREFERLVATNPYLAAPARTAITVPVSVADVEDQTDLREVRLFTGEDVSSQLEIVEGAIGDGAVVPDHVAEALDLSIGDTLTMVSDRNGSTTVPVDGIYRRIYHGNLSGYWRPWRDELIQRCFDCPPPPQPVLMSEATFLGSSAELNLDHVGFAWQAPLDRDELTLDEGDDAARRSQAITQEMSDRRLFTECGLRFFCTSRTGPGFGSSIDEIVRDTHRRIGAVEGPANLLRVAGILVALLVVAGAGAFAMAARRVESTLLFARGARPRAVGTRAALEALVPSAVGAALGLGLAFLLVRAAGPDGALASSATSLAARATGLAVVATVFAVGLVSTVSFLRQSEHHRGRFGFLAALPWELVLIALSLFVLDRLQSGGAVVEDPAIRTQSPSLLLLAFPVLFLAGFVALAARATVLLVRWLRGRSERLPSPPYLAVHRLAARPKLTLLLISAAGLCLGLFVQAQMVARSMQTTVDVKAGVFVGSDVAVSIDRTNETPTGFPYPTTRVVQRLLAGEFRPGVPFDLLAIGADTFADAAFWDPAFGAGTAQELVDDLSRASGDTLPIVLAAGGGTAPDSITIDTKTVPVDVVARSSAFPGMTSLRPLVVVEAGRLEDAFADQWSPLGIASADHELWIRGDADGIAGALPEVGFPTGLVIEAEQVKDIPYISAVIDTFIVMNGLGLLAALLVFAAMLMYLQARQRAEIVSYGLSLRMGMRSTSHLLAIATEVAAMLAVAFVAGAALAVVAANLIVPLLDPLEAIPPSPLTVVPVPLIVATAPLLLLVAFFGGWLTERRARSADLGQVMRLAE
jgi:putative ABC transport system permease protein